MRREKISRGPHRKCIFLHVIVVIGFLPGDSVFRRVQLAHKLRGSVLVKGVVSGFELEVGTIGSGHINGNFGEHSQEG